MLRSTTIAYKIKWRLALKKYLLHPIFPLYQYQFSSLLFLIQTSRSWGNKFLRTVLYTPQSSITILRSLHLQLLFTGTVTCYTAAAPHHNLLLLLLLHTAAAVPHAYSFSSLLIILFAAAHHPRCLCHLHHFICCC